MCIYLLYVDIVESDTEKKLTRVFMHHNVSIDYHASYSQVLAESSIITYIITMWFLFFSDSGLVFIREKSSSKRK